MKKILLIISLVAIFSIPAICQVPAYNVNVDWTEYCDCLGYDQNNYFKVTITIYDDVNGVWVEPSITGTVNWPASDIDLPTTNVESHCEQATKTPSFTIRATVWFMETSTNPETVCCSNSAVKTGVTCGDIAAGFPFGTIILN